MLFALGIVAVILLTVLPYYLEGSTAIWWKSVVLASLEYAGARRYSLWSFVPMTFIIGGLFYLGWKKKYLDYSDKTVQLLSFVVLALLFTFIKGGRINGHYLIQLHPVFVILFAILVSKISLFKRFNYQPYVFFLLLLLPVESYLEYANIIRNKLERGTFYNGEGISVPQYIKQNKIDSKNILFLGYHIGYWNLNAKPPTKSSTHPSNICRNELFQFYDNSRKTGIEEITFIMEKVQPSVVVIRKNKSVFDPKNIEENQYINEYLKTYYQKPQSVDLAEIYIKL